MKNKKKEIDISDRTLIIIAKIFVTIFIIACVVEVVAFGIICFDKWGI